MTYPLSSSLYRAACLAELYRYGTKRLLFVGLGTDDARVAAIQALLAAGAEVDAQNGDGYTALHLASLAIKPKLVAALIHGGARVDLATSSHKSATV